MALRFIVHDGGRNGWHSITTVLRPLSKLCSKIIPVLLGVTPRNEGSPKEVELGDEVGHLLILITADYHQAIV